MGSDVNTLAEPLRSSVINLMAAAQADGTQVVVVSARRTQEEQIALRRQNCGTSEYDIWQKPSGKCRPETAIPGTSRHQDGTAVDLGGDLGYVARNASRFGLVKTVSTEDWHFEHASTAGRGGPTATDHPNEGTKSGGSIFDKAGNIIGAGPGLVTGLGDSAAEKFIPGYGVVKDAGSAAVAVAAAILNPQTWLRAVGIVAGLGLTVVGLNIISKDIGGPSVDASTVANATPVGRAATVARKATPTPAQARKATPPTTAVTP